MAEDFKLQISIDGTQACAEARRLREVVERELAQTVTVSFDAAALGELRQALGRLAVRGQVELPGLAGALEQVQTLRQLAQQPVVVRVAVEAAGLAEAGAQLARLRKDAQGVGAALTQGLSGQWEKLETQLGQFQQQLTGLVRSGSGGLAGGLGLPALEATLDASSKKTLKLTQDARQLQASLDAINARMAELGTMPVQPLGGGRMAALSELFRGFESPGVKGAITRKLKEVDAELETFTVTLGDKQVKLAAEIRKRQQAEMAAAEQALAALRPRLDALNAALEEKLAAQPPGSALSTAFWSAERQQWEAEYQALLAEQQDAARELDAARSRQLTGDTEELVAILERRRRELEVPLRDDLAFWKEWSLRSVAEVAQGLRASGQSAAAMQLEQLQGLLEQRKVLLGQLEKVRGGLAQGAQLELPSDAKGTLVDLVAGERELGAAAAPVSKILSEQAKALDKLTKSLDAAGQAAQGLGKAEREALGKLEAAAQREIRGSTKAGTPVEDVGTASRAVLTRLAQEVQATTAVMQEALAQPVTGAAEAQARGLLRVWEWVAEKLVGHSVVPDMVQDINAWLARIQYVPDADPFAGIVQDAEAAADGVLDAFDRLLLEIEPEEIAQRITVLQAELQLLNAKAGELSFAGVGAAGESSAYTRAKFAQAVEEARRVRGDSGEDEAWYARGYLPGGIGLAAETTFDKGKQRYDQWGSKISEADAQWRRVINTDIVERRFTPEEAAELDKLSQQIAVKNAELVGLLEQRAADLSESLGSLETESDFEATFAELERVQFEINELQGAAGEFKAAAAADLAAVQAEQEKALRTYARSPEGRVETATRVEQLKAERVLVAQEAKAATAERVAQAQAERVALEQEARATTATQVEQARASRVVTEQEAKAVTAERVAQARAERMALEQEAKATAATQVEQARASRVVTEQEAKAATAERVAQAKQETARLTAEAKAREAQKIETAKRATLKAGTQRKIEVEETKAAHAAQLLTLRAQTAEQERQAQATAQAQRLAAELGREWADVQGEMQAAGKSIDTIVGELRRAESTQQRVTRTTTQTGVAYRGVYGWVRKFADALDDAQLRNMGLRQLAGDIQQVGQSGQFAAAAVTGGATIAARDYAEYAAQIGQVSRAVLLAPELRRPLENLVMESAADFGLLQPSEIAAGLTTWAKATGQVVESEADLRDMLQQTLPIQQLAALDTAAIGPVTEGVAAALGQFNLRMADTNRIVAVFAQVSDNTIASVDSVAEAFKYVGPQAGQLGEDIEAVAAIVTSLANAGIQGSMAGTTYRSMLVSMTKQTKQAQAALEAVFGPGNPFFDAAGQFIGTAAAIDKLAAATAQMTQEERGTLLSQLFDTRALTAVNALVDEQGAARERGINILRAQEKLARGVVDAETAAYAALKQETQGMVVAQVGALELWQKRLDAWNADDSKRVQQAELRWKAFWLTIGQQALDLALPALERGGQAIERITALLQRSPLAQGLVQAGLALAVGAGGLATLVAAAVKTITIIQSVETLVVAWKAMLAGEKVGQVTAAAKFNATVVAAGQQFAAAITQAATTAAATEQTGAEVETATEVGGGAAEAEVEIAGAVTEEAIEAGSKAGATAAGGAAATVAAGGTLSLGGILGSVLGGIGGGFAGHEALARTELGQRLGLLEGTAGKALSLLAYGAGTLVGRETEWAQAIADLTGVTDAGAETLRRGFTAAGLTLEVAARRAQQADAARWSGRAGVTPTTPGVYQYTAPAASVALTEGQLAQIQAYEEYLRAHADAVQNYNQTLEKLGRELARDLTQLEQDYTQQRAATVAAHAAEQAKALAQYQQAEARAAEEHQRDMRRMEEDYYTSLWELTLNRDARGMYLAQRDYAQKRQRAEEDYATQRQRAAAEFAQSQAEREAQFQQELADQRTQYETARAERLAAYATQRQELVAEHNAELQALQQAAYNKIKQLQGYNLVEQATIAAHQQGLLTDLGVWLSANRALWASYVASLPVPRTSGAGSPAVTPLRPTKGGPATALGAGGYAAHGLYELGERAGAEFVLNAATTRALEQQVGGPLTQQNVVNRGVTVHAQFTGMGGGDRAWFETRLRDFAGQLAGMLEG